MELEYSFSRALRACGREGVDGEIYISVLAGSPAAAAAESLSLAGV